MGGYCLESVCIVYQFLCSVGGANISIIIALGYAHLVPCVY